MQFKDRFTFLCNKCRLRQHLESTLDEPTKWIYISVEGKEPVKVSNHTSASAEHVSQRNAPPFLDRSSYAPHCLAAGEASSFYPVAPTGVLLEHLTNISSRFHGVGPWVSCHLYNAFNHGWSRGWIRWMGGKIKLSWQSNTQSCSNLDIWSYAT